MHGTALFSSPTHSDDDDDDRKWFSLDWDCWGHRYYQHITIGGIGEQASLLHVFFCHSSFSLLARRLRPSYEKTTNYQ